MVEVTALALVAVDELVDGLVTDPRPAFSSESSTDLFRAPTCPETVGNDELERAGEAHVLPTFLFPFHRQGVGSFMPVATLTGVPPNLSTHSRGMHSKEFGDTAHGVAFFPKNVDLDPIIVRELSVLCAPVFRCNSLSPWTQGTNVSLPKPLHLMIERTTDFLVAPALNSPTSSVRSTFAQVPECFCLALPFPTPYASTAYSAPLINVFWQVAV